MDVDERRAVRAGVLDARERVLLVRFSFPDGTELWATPGGGVEGDEDDAGALRRELAEEVGLGEAVIGPCLAALASILAGAIADPYDIGL